MFFLMPLIFPLLLSLAIQFLLWFNLLFPYNLLFEGFNRTLYMIFSASGFFAASISLIFYRMLVLEPIHRRFFIIAVLLQFFSLFSCTFFFASSVTGWLALV